MKYWMPFTLGFAILWHGLKHRVHRVMDSDITRWALMGLCTLALLVGLVEHFVK